MRNGRALGPWRPARYRLLPHFSAFECADLACFNEMSTTPGDWGEPQVPYHYDSAYFAPLDAQLTLFAQITSVRWPAVSAG